MRNFTVVQKIEPLVKMTLKKEKKKYLIEDPSKNTNKAKH